MDGNIIIERAPVAAARNNNRGEQALTLPPPRRGHGRCYDEEMRLALIPPDDVEFKKKAIEFFLAGELANNACGEEIDRTMAEDRRLAAELELTRALTPGGIAWRLSEAVRVMENEEEPHTWAIEVIRAALADAIEQERARRISRLDWPGENDQSARLSANFIELNRRLSDAENRVDECARNSPHRARLEALAAAANDARSAVIDELISVPANTAAGLRGKLRVLSAFAENLDAADNPEAPYVAPRIFASVMDDLDRLTARFRAPAPDRLLELQKQWLAAVRNVQAITSEGTTLEGVSAASEEQEHRLGQALDLMTSIMEEIGATRSSSLEGALAKLSVAVFEYREYGSLPEGKIDPHERLMIAAHDDLDRLLNHPLEMPQRYRMLAAE
jgi:hypothetical protein